MRRFAAHAVVALLLVVSAVAVTIAGPVTAHPAAALIENLPDAARMLAAIAIAL